MKKIYYILPIVLGMINLERENSQSLIEKTNREGFIENDAYRAFLRSLHFFINEVEISFNCFSNFSNNRSCFCW